MTTSNDIAMNLPKLDGKDYEYWSIQMKAIFGFQDCLDVVQAGIPEINANSSEAQRIEHKEAKKRDCKAIFLLHQCVDRPNFEKISTASSSKEAWNTLEKSYAGSLKVKKVRLQMMRRQYELLPMEEQETIVEYINRIRSLTDLMKGYGDKLDEQGIVDKVLRTLTTRFDNVVIAIEEAKDLDQLKLDLLLNLFYSLFGTEERIKRGCREEKKMRNEESLMFGLKRVREEVDHIHHFPSQHVMRVGGK
ncbi:hypothetical protein Lal_00032768 [Lupinus albus]|nr:hypothetical protein Lal_00032768 [Lupinus albus]